MGPVGYGWTCPDTLTSPLSRRAWGQIPLQSNSCLHLPREETGPGQKHTLLFLPLLDIGQSSWHLFPKPFKFCCFCVCVGFGWMKIRSGRILKWREGSKFKGRHVRTHRGARGCIMKTLTKVLGRTEQHLRCTVDKVSVFGRSCSRDLLDTWAALYPYF